MSLVSFDAENIISRLVEAMLPRFSDQKLGLYIVLDLSFSDYGYADDGNTKEREALHVREYFSFLFVRPSNYTKVFFYRPSKDAKGLTLDPSYSKEPVLWTLECDHDSCWRSDGMRQITKIYFEATKQFEGRLKSGKPLTHYDISQCHNLSFASPYYVELDKFTQVYSDAPRYSEIERLYWIHMNKIDFSNLEMFNCSDIKKYGQHGLFIKGSEDYQREVSYCKRCLGIGDSIELPRNY